MILYSLIAYGASFLIRMPRGLAQKAKIPCTAVHGSFKSTLQKDVNQESQSRTRQCADGSGPTYSFEFQYKSLSKDSSEQVGLEPSPHSRAGDLVEAVPRSVVRT